MSTPKLTKCRGLYTSGNRYEAPEGALVQASNILILKDGVIQPRWQIGPSDASGGAPAPMALGDISHWHRMAVINGKLTAIGRDTVAQTVTFGRGAPGASFNGIGGVVTGIQAPSGYANYTSATALPYFDNEILSRGAKGYVLDHKAIYRYFGNSTVIEAGLAGGYPCAISCIPRPIKIVAGQISRTSNVVTVNTPFNHGYVAGVKVTMTSAGEAGFPSGEKTITSVTTSAFTYAEVAADATSGADQIFVANQLVGSSGFLDTDEKVGYRALLVEYDAEGKEYVREVSGRVVVSNASPFVGAAANKNVQLAVIVSTDTPTSNAKVELYRTKRTTGNVGDEMTLVFSKFLSYDELSNRVVWITDITPDDFGGKQLYINESQDNTTGNNSVIPACKTIGSWGNRMVQANIVGRPFLDMVLKSVDSASGGLAAGDVFSIYTSSDNDFTAVASTAGFTSALHFTVYTGGVMSTDVANTVASLVDSINWALGPPSANKYIAELSLSGAGAFTVREVVPLDAYEYGEAGAMIKTVSAKTTGTSTRDCFAPKLGVKSAVSGSPVRGAPGASDTVLITTTANHNFEVGEYVVWYSTWATQAQGSIQGTAVEGKITAKTATTITIENAGLDGTAGASGGVVALKFRPLIIGKREKNLVRVSRRWTNEAFTDLATERVGSSEAHVLKVWGLDDTLLVFKEDGLFKVTASGADGLTISSELLDPTAILWAKDSVASVGGKVYAWLRGGVARIGPGGVEAYVSAGRVDDKLSPATDSTGSAALDDLPFSQRAVGLGDDVLGVYELRACMTASPSAPYASTVNLIYCPGTDTWVTDDLTAIGACIDKGLRYFQLGTLHYFQQRGVTLTGSAVWGVSAPTDLSYNSTTKIATFTYTAATVDSHPAVGATVALTTSHAALGKVISRGSGTGAGKVCTAYFPSMPSGSPVGLSFWNPVISTVEWAPVTFSSENQLKHQRELQVLFGVQSLLQYAVATYTELVRTQESNTRYTPFDGSSYNYSGGPTDPPGITQFVPVTDRLPVPQQHRVCQQLSVVLTIPSALETWTILGIGADGKLVGPKVNR